MGIKIIFWDLDNTLWDGVIAEGVVTPKHELFTAIKYLNKRGVVNSIVSHNEFDLPKKFLEELGYWESFVFPKISWSKKAPKILETLDQMHLRAENALFIDDRQHNLDEAMYYIKGINLINPTKQDTLPLLYNIADKDGKDDSKLSRHKQYKLLEVKTEEKNTVYVNDEYAFLKDSDIKINFEECLSNLDRIYELVSRTNQLNYTKNRQSKEQLKVLILDGNYRKYLISVKDKFGDYGIVGFVVLSNKNVVKHFVFSCRILNMGIESFLFHTLKLPKFEVVGTVAYNIYDYTPCWITEGYTTTTTGVVSTSNSILIGGCDLAQMEQFLDGKFYKYFNYVSSTNRKLEVHRDSIDLLMSGGLNNKQKQFIIDTCPFIDKNCFDIPKFDSYSVIVYSPLIDYIQGKYISTTIKDYYLSCNPFLKDGILDEEKFKRLFKTKGIARGDVEKFHTNWVYTEKPYSVYEKQLMFLFDKMIHAKVFVLLGATTTYASLDEDKFEKHKYINNLIEYVVSGYSNITLVKPDKYIKSRDDFTNAIRHYKRHVYYNIAQEINGLLNS